MKVSSIYSVKANQCSEGVTELTTNTLLVTKQSIVLKATATSIYPSSDAILFLHDYSEKTLKSDRNQIFFLFFVITRFERQKQNSMEKRAMNNIIMSLEIPTVCVCM